MSHRAKALAEAIGLQKAQSSKGRTQSLIRCISWNVRGLCNERRRKIVGRYLREWGATMACIQETKLERCKTQDWNMVGRGFLEGFLEVNANGCLGGVIVTWNETVFTKVDTRMGQFSVAIKFKK